MSLTASLSIGRTALTASQLAIQVAGDNLANAATPGFHRRTAALSPTSGGTGLGNVNVGRGVSVGSVTRTIDLAVQARLRSAIADDEAAGVAADIFARLEGLTNELDGQGLGGRLTEFFEGFSELANNPNASETRALLVERGASLAQFMRGMRKDLVDLRGQIDDQIGSNVEQANELLEKIERINRSIALSEQGGAEDSGLRDQRDSMIQDLSGLVEISVNEQDNGLVDIFVGSTPVLLSGQSRGLEFEVEGGTGPDSEARVLVKEKLEEKIAPQSGVIGGLLAQRNGAVDEAIQELDDLSAALIHEVNRIHSSGAPSPGLTETLGEREVPLADRTLALNDPANATFAGLPFSAGNGSFEVVVRDAATGQSITRTIDVDLDGIVDSTGAAGFTEDTTLDDIRAALDGVPNLSATLDPDGRLRITADNGFEFGFRNDSSGALAVLGVNTYFTGTGAADIGVRQELRDNPQLLVAGSTEGGNDRALAVSALQERAVDSLGGLSLTEGWRRTTERIAVGSAGAQAEKGAAGQVRASLNAQRAATSGVSIDEESINLLQSQRQFQAAAQFISTIDELTQTLISLV